MLETAMTERSDVVVQVDFAVVLVGVHVVVVVVQVDFAVVLVGVHVSNCCHFVWMFLSFIMIFLLCVHLHHHLLVLVRCVVVSVIGSNFVALVY